MLDVTTFCPRVMSCLGKILPEVPAATIKRRYQISKGSRAVFSQVTDKGKLSRDYAVTQECAVYLANSETVQKVASVVWDVRRLYRMINHSPEYRDLWTSFFFLKCILWTSEYVRTARCHTLPNLEGPMVLRGTWMHCGCVQMGVTLKQSIST